MDEYNITQKHRRKFEYKRKSNKNTENNKELTWNELKIIGVGLLITIGITVGVKNRTNVINKLIDKK